MSYLDILLLRERLETLERRVEALAGICQALADEVLKGDASDACDTIEAMLKEAGFTPRSGAV